MLLSSVAGTLCLSNKIRTKFIIIEEIKKNIYNIFKVPTEIHLQFKLKISRITKKKVSILLVTDLPKILQFLLSFPIFLTY